MRMAVSGDGYFVKRYEPLLRALALHADAVDAVPGGNLAEWLPMRVYNRLTRGTALHGKLLSPDPNPLAFAIRSRQAQRALAGLVPKPDVVLQIFGTFSPAWKSEPVSPYALYLDFTMAQAIREYPPWAGFASRNAQIRWLRQERVSYDRASHIFTMTEAAKGALTADYSVPSSKISVVGNGGNVAAVFDGPKRFGTHKLLFDGSDLHRKGGDVLLAALAEVRTVLPSATLTIVGNTVGVRQDGVASLGPVHDPAAMRRLFLSADLVVTPARCDPFPGFVVEAMNFGVPVVASQCSGASDALARHEAGLVVAELTGTAFAQTILALLTDSTRLEQMSASGRRAVRERFNWHAIAAVMGPVLRSCAAV